MSSGPSNLYDLASALLAAAAGTFIDNGVVAPELQYVYGAGLPPATCDQLVVSWEAVNPAVPGATNTLLVLQSGGLIAQRSARLQLWTFRCLVGGLQGEGLQLTEPVDPVRMNFDAERVMTDAYILHRGIVAAHYSGAFGKFADGLAIGQALPLPADGGVGGCVITLEAELS